MNNAIVELHEVGNSLHYNARRKRPSPAAQRAGGRWAMPVEPNTPRYRSTSASSPIAFA